MLKIAYFDENSAMDYLEMKNEGIVEVQQEESNSNKGEIGSSVGGSIQSGVITKLLEPFVKLTADVSLNGSLSKIGER